jgi:DNA-binding response OmpR family regulator
MKNDNGRGKVLLVDDDQNTITWLKAIAEQSGYDVSTLSGIRKAEETTVLLKCIKFDLVAISSALVNGSPGVVTILRQALDCPVILYEGGTQTVIDGIKVNGAESAWLKYTEYYSQISGN